MGYIDYCWNCETEIKHNGQWCCECGRSEHEDMNEERELEDCIL